MNSTDAPRADARTWAPSREHVIVFGVAFVVALLVIFVAWGSQGLVDNRPDPYWFSAMGQSVARGDGFRDFGVMLHRRSPLYPLVIGGIYWLFGTREVLVQLLQAALFAGTAVIAYVLGARLFNLRTARLAALFCAFHPSLLRYVPDFHLETMFTFFLTLGVWAAVRFHERPTLRRAAAFGVIWALATLTKAVTLLYPVVFVALYWLFIVRKQSLRAILPTVPAVAVAALCMALTIAPWTMRNYYATGGHFVPVATGASDAFLRGYVFSKTDYALLRRPPYTDAENESNAMFREICAKAGAVWEADDYQTDKILNAAAKERLLSSPGDFVRKSVVGVFTFWYEMTTLKTSLAAGLTALAAWVVAAFGFGRARRERRPVWLLLSPILYVNLFLAMLLALGRYSVPVLPCLMVLAAFGADTILDRYRVRFGSA